MSTADSVIHIFYENHIPPEIEGQLVTLYQSAFCVEKYFELYKLSHDSNALVVYEEKAVPVHIIIYNIADNELTVLNELVHIEPRYLQYISTALFTRYPAITVLNFNRLKSRISDFSYPWRLWQTSQDIAIELPDDCGDYHAKLGKQTQKHIRYYINRLHREFGDAAFNVAAAQDIAPSVIARIIEMNRMRMKSKRIRSGFDSSFEQRIVKFCAHYGLVSTVSIGGNIVAGAICYEVGSHVYLEVVSHDADFNKYNVGQICLYLTIKHMIERGKTVFHMLWGENEYKYRFLGVRHELVFISVYRSGFSKLSGFPKLMQHACARAVDQFVHMINKHMIARCR